MLLIEGRFCFADRYNVHAVEVFAIPILDLFTISASAPWAAKSARTMGAICLCSHATKTNTLWSGTRRFSSAACRPSLS